MLHTRRTPSGWREKWTNCRSADDCWRSANTLDWRDEQTINHSTFNICSAAEAAAGRFQLKAVFVDATTWFKETATCSSADSEETAWRSEDDEDDEDEEDISWEVKSGVLLWSRDYNLTLY